LLALTLAGILSDLGHDGALLVKAAILPGAAATRRR
jgi:hypothetical protein